MKKFCILFFTLFIIFLSVLGSCLSVGTESQAIVYPEYLRIHIRANSNGAADQAVKYIVRDEVVAVLTPLVAHCTDKQTAVDLMAENLDRIERTATRVLRQNGFSYEAHARIQREEFPTRVYEDYTLEAGFYDALVLDLGAGVGDNWWCCIYPPFCFTGEQAGVQYRSAIWEIINAFCKG